MLEFFYDVGSPWTYLAFHEIGDVAAEAGIEVTWKPILVGGVFNAVNPGVYAARENASKLRWSHMAKDLADWLGEQGMTHTRGKPYHPMTQGKIERWHLSLKSRILLENYYLPGDLERAVGAFVDHYNHRRYHESLDNLTPADVYFGRGQRILDMRKEIKRKTIETRRRRHFKLAA